MRATTDLSEQDLASVLRAMRLAEDLRARALRLADVELREVTVAAAQEASDAAVLEAVRLAEDVRGRALRMADVELREVTRPVRRRPPTARCLEGARRERMAVCLGMR